MNYLYRYYFPPGATRDRIVGVFIYLELPEVGDYTVPVCFAFAAKFAQPVGVIKVDDDWETDDIMGALSEKPGPRSLTQEECDSFLTGATAASAFVIPLCELTCQDDLRTQVVTPLLDLQGRFVAA